MKRTKIELASAETCTGCGACSNICSFNTITMCADSAGFLHPSIDPACCTACGACMRICPVLHRPPSGPEEPACYAAWAPDNVRILSSSGGVFTLLAQEMLRNGGVVIGAELTEDFSVKHVCIETEADLYRLNGSKYVQSETGDIYRRVLSLLNTGRLVLFSGTPCQVAGLKGFLGSVPEGLLTAEVMCHGVPSHKMLQDYLKENFASTSLSNIAFRDKERGWNCNELTLFLSDGTKKVVDFEDCAYEQGYHLNTILRRSCYNCPFCGKSRQGDLSLGDFWGIEAFDPSWNDGKGTSLVYCNTECGNRWWERIRPQLERWCAVPLSTSQGNRVQEKIKGRERRERFDVLREKENFTQAADIVAHEKYDIGLVGCWSVENYGSNMTYFALYQWLTDLGYEVLMIERPLTSLWKPHRKPTGFSENPYPEYALAPLFPDKWAMHTLNAQCDTFILGSDQLLYHELYRAFDEFIDMDYIHADKKKIAFATSVGRDCFEGTKAQRQKLQLYLRKFDAISVRERSAVALMEKEFGVKADWVLDPVFLCDRSYYDRMAEKAVPITTKPYIAVYIVDPAPDKEKALRWLSEKYSLPLYVFTDIANSTRKVKEAWTQETVQIASNEEWLRAIRDSSFFVTDSFHGTCFSLIFRKNFISICNIYRGASRFESLLGSLDLTDRMVYQAEEIPEHPNLLAPVSYETVEGKLEKLISDSMEWLKSALQAPHDADITETDLQWDQIALLAQRLNEVEQRGLTTESWLSNTHQRTDACETRMNEEEQRSLATESWLSNTHQRMDACETRMNEEEQRSLATESWLSNTHQRMDACETHINEEEQRSLTSESWLSNTHQRMDACETHLNEGEQNKHTIESCLDNTLRRMDTCETRLNEEEQRSLATESWLCNTHQRMDACETRLDEEEQRSLATESWLSNTHQRMDACEMRMNEEEQRSLATESWLSNTHQRMDACEQMLHTLENELPKSGSKKISKTLRKIWNRVKRSIGRG